MRAAKKVKMILSKALAMVCAAAMVVSSVPALAFADVEAVGHNGQSGFELLADGNIAEGVSGTCMWTIDSKGALVVRPTDGEQGELAGWSSTEGAPWYRYCDQITSARFVGEVKASTCKGMFYGCSSLASVNLSGLNTSTVTDMGSMFCYCVSLATLELSDIDTSSATNMSSMFDYCSSLTSLDLSGFDTSSVTDMGAMFWSCFRLSSLDLSDFDTSCVMDMHGMFYGCSGLSTLDLSSFDTSSVKDIYWMFYGCKGIKSLDLSNFETSSVTDMHGMFDGCLSLSSLDVSGFDTTSVTDMSSLFCNCSSLSALDLSGFSTSSVTDMSSLFDYCTSLSTVDLSNFDTSSVTDMGSLFYYCTSLTLLDVSGFDTSSVTDMSSMFDYCTSLSTLDLSSFDTSAVTDMSYMFDCCTSLTRIEVGAGWDNASVEISDCMFLDCTSLVGAKGTAYSPSHVDADYARIDGGPGSNAPGYLTYKAVSLTARLSSDPARLGQTVKMVCTVSGAEDTTLTYQWQWANSADAKCWHNATVASSRNSSIKLLATETRAKYWYRCVVTASDGRTVTTEPTQIKVLPTHKACHPIAAIANMKTPAFIRQIACPCVYQVSKYLNKNFVASMGKAKAR